MRLRVAITRAAPENAHTARRLQDLGHIPLLAPLLDIQPRPFDANIDGVQALLFTSSSGVHAFASHSHARGAPVLAVGDATAQAARTQGFASVRSAGGDVESLSALVIGTLDPSAGKLLHIAGTHVAGDLQGTLRKAGYSIERRLAYEAVAVTTLPKCFQEPLDAVLFHSARAAAIFADLGAPKADKLAAVCMSDAVAEAAKKTVWKQVLVAAAPREDALLATLHAV